MKVRSRFWGTSEYSQVFMILVNTEYPDWFSLSTHVLKSCIRRGS